MSHQFQKQPLPGYDHDGNELESADNPYRTGGNHPHHPDLPMPTGLTDQFEEIVRIPDKHQRLSEILGLDTYTQSDELEMFQEYFTDLLKFPTIASWTDPDEIPPVERQVRLFFFVCLSLFWIS